VLALTTGIYTSCVLLKGGTVKCWGFGKDGELGNGALDNSYSAVAVSGIQNAIGISGGGYNRCAILSDGTTSCWGDNQWGELGNTPTPSPYAVPSPQSIPALSGASFIGGAFRSACGLFAGSVRCWGLSYDGMSGSMWTVPNITTAVGLGVDAAYACALLDDGTVSCWGNNDEGQLGNGTESFTPSMTPVPVSNLGGATAIAVGGEFACALIAGGTVSCCGYDSTGQLGSGPLQCTGGNGGSCSPIPIAVPGLNGVSAITAGDKFVCALLAGGTVTCWGDNVNGELGNGTTTTSFAPVPVSGLSHVTAIAAGLYHVCALIEGGTVECWGSGGFDQLGTAPMEQCADQCSKTPVAANL
jgi:alpha-tubulin suppressor-like RCC1 family protein